MIIHLGYPKCASTTLQQLFEHSEALFLGSNTKNPPGEFYHPEIGFFIEEQVRLGREDDFKSKSPKIKEFLKKQDRKTKGKLILSYENLSVRLTPWDNPTDIKLRRIGDILPRKSIALLCFRDLKPYIISLYKNHLSFGYTGTFDQFVEELVLTSNFGMLRDLDLAEQTRQIKEFLKPKSLILFKLDDGNNIKTLFEILDLQYTKEGHFNEGFQDDKLDTIRIYNKSRGNRKRFLDWLETHRLFPKSIMKEEDQFHLPRLRIDQNERLKTCEDTHIFNPDTIEWPSEINILERKNIETLQGFRSDKKITLL